MVRRRRIIIIINPKSLKKNYFFFKTQQIAPPFQKRVQWIESLDNFFLKLGFKNSFRTIIKTGYKENHCFFLWMVGNGD